MSVDVLGRPMMRTAAAELIATLHDEGISHLFVNPGMHTAPLRNALAEAETAGMPHPVPVLCVHEHVAFSAAHGHHLAGEAPQAVMVHLESGQFELDGVVVNAHRNRVPMTVFCGEGGELGGQVSGARLPPQLLSEPGLVSATSKWTADLARAGDAAMLVRRAFQIARTEPAGVTRVDLPVELLNLKAGAPSRRLPAPRPPAPDLSALDEMAALLATAEWPVIVAGRVGRHVASVQHLARLAETLGAPVLDIRNNVNLPPQHPLYAGREGKELLDRADAILLLDADVPCVPGIGPLPYRAWLLQIDVDCLKADWPGWTYPVEVAVTADTELALPQLVTLVSDRLAPHRRRVQDRRKRVERALRIVHQTWRERAVSPAPEDLGDAMLAELNSWLAEDALIVEEVTVGLGSTIRQLQRPPGHLFRVRSESPGWSLGSAFGVRLARPGQPAVAICDESSFASALPSAAFWSAHRSGAPFLTVVLDRCRCLETGAVQRPEQEVAAVARASGVEVAAVDAPGEIAGTLERLLATTRDGVCAVMDVRLPAVESDLTVQPKRKLNQLTRASTATKQGRSA